MTKLLSVDAIYILATGSTLQIHRCLNSFNCNHAKLLAQIAVYSLQRPGNLKLSPKLASVIEEHFLSIKAQKVILVPQNTSILGKY